jgi:hypothetical protein
MRFWDDDASELHLTKAAFYLFYILIAHVGIIYLYTIAAKM